MATGHRPRGRSQADEIGRAMDVTFGVLLMTAVMVLAVGLLADMIDKRL